MKSGKPPAAPHGIFFHFDAAIADFPDQRHFKTLIKAILRQEGRTLRSLHFHFVDDAALLSINRAHLGHDNYTDVITFPYNTKPIEADIYVSIDRVLDNARSLGVVFDEELFRVMTHGVLHLCGWDDKTPESAALMRRREDACLKLIHL